MNVVLVPMGVTDAVLQTAAKALEETYDAEIDVGGEKQLPTAALSGSRIDKYLGYDVQYDAENVIENMNISSTGDKHLIITNEPLSFEGTFVFGISYLDGDVGIFSTYKLKDESGSANARIRKQAIKQIGYMIGYKHCDQHHCVMYQTATCDDLDKTSASFCDDCHRTFQSKLAPYKTSDTEVYEEPSIEQSASDTRIYDPDE